MTRNTFKLTLAVLLSFFCSNALLHGSTGTKAYPLQECLVSDNKLGSMGKPYKFVYEPQNQEVILCCKPCIKKFNKKPERYLSKLAEEIEAGSQK